MPRLHLILACALISACAEPQFRKHAQPAEADGQDADGDPGDQGPGDEGPEDEEGPNDGDAQDLGPDDLADETDQDGTVIDDAGMADAGLDAGTDGGHPPATCEPNPCQHDGICSLVDGAPHCQCPVTFGGTTCATDVDECQRALTICTDGKTCHNLVGSSECRCDPPRVLTGESCACPAGYTGTSCESCGPGHSRNQSGECVADGNVRLTVEMEGDGRGTISFGGVTCSGSPCYKDMAPGTYELTATPTTLNTDVASWEGASCTGSSCWIDLTADTTLRVRFELRYNVAFATRPLPFGQFNDPAQADALCATEARAADIHGTTFRAWLSSEGPTPELDDDVHAVDRLGPGRGWINLDGYPVARDVTELSTTGLLYPILAHEFVGEADNRSVYTGTTRGGLLGRYQGDPQDCNGWRDPSGRFLAGTLGATHAEWTEWAVVYGCADRQARLYCFGVDGQDEVPLPQASGRHVFVSDAAWNPSSGRGAADALCAAEASAASLHGTFLALIGTSTQQAADRFVRSGATWVRMDGLPWLARPAELGGGRGARTSAVFLASGARAPTDGLSSVITGGVISPSGDGTCADWTANSGWTEGGSYLYGGPLAWDSHGLSCEASWRVLCLEQ